MQSKNDVVSYLFIFGGPYSLPYPSLLCVILLGDVGENAESLHYRFGDEGGGAVLQVKFIQIFERQSRHEKKYLFFQRRNVHKTIAQFFLLFFLFNFYLISPYVLLKCQLFVKNKQILCKMVKMVDILQFSPTLLENQPIFIDFSEK